MKKLFLLMCCFLITSCSLIFKPDVPPYEETKGTVEFADTFYAPQIPMYQKAAFYQKIFLERQGSDNFYVTEVNLNDASDPYGYSASYWKNYSSDAAIFGGSYLATCVWQWNVLKQEDPNSTGTLFARQQIDRWLDWSYMMSHITGTPGLVVRFAAPMNKVNPKDKYRPGVDPWKDWFYASDASPGQYYGVVKGLFFCLHYGPPELNQKCTQALVDIGTYLRSCNYVLKDTDGSLTGVPDFINNDGPSIVVGSDDYGKIVLTSRDGYNEGSRALSLMAIMKAAASTGNQGMVDAYNDLVLRGIAYETITASIPPLNFDEYLDIVIKSAFVKKVVLEVLPEGYSSWEIAKVGTELSGFDRYLIVLDPKATAIVGDQRVIPFYQESLEKSWKNVGAVYDNPVSGFTWFILKHDPQALSRSIRRQQEMPYPARRKYDLINSNRPDVTISPYTAPGKKLDSIITTPHGVLPLYESPAAYSAWTWERDPRQLNQEGDGTREPGYDDWLYTYWLGRWSGAIGPTD